MGNNITSVLPSIFAGLNTVSRELIGAIPNIQRDATMERAAVGQTVTVPVVAPATGSDIAPGVTPANEGNQTIGAMPVKITKARQSPVMWNGEEQRTLGPTGQYNKILADQFAESFRWLANQVEADIVALARKSASRAYGGAGTIPFGTAGDLTDFAGVNRILDKNGAPRFGRCLIVGSDASFNLEGKQNLLFKVNEAGTDELLRNRNLPRVAGFTLGYSAGVDLATKGTGTGYLVNNVAGYAIGDTAIEVDTGNGTILPGDVVTFAADTANKYVVADLTGSVLTLNAPGLRVAIPDGNAITVGNDYTGCPAWTRDALVLAARPPAAPIQGDAATDVQFVTDPVSGIVFEIRLYPMYRQVKFEVGLAWGVGLVKSAHIGLLLG